MKKLIYLINYPLWYILTQTYLVVILVSITLILPGVLLSLLFPQMINGSSVEENESIGIGMGMLSIMLSPFIAYPLMKWHAKSKIYYLENGYYKERYC